MRSRDSQVPHLPSLFLWGCGPELLFPTVHLATHKRRRLARDNLGLVFDLLEFQALGQPIIEELGFLNLLDSLPRCRPPDVATTTTLAHLARTRPLTSTVLAPSFPRPDRTHQARPSLLWGGGSTSTLTRNFAPRQSLDLLGPIDISSLLHCPLPRHPPSPSFLLHPVHRQHPRRASNNLVQVAQAVWRHALYRGPFPLRGPRLQCEVAFSAVAFSHDTAVP